MTLDLQQPRAIGSLEYTPRQTGTNGLISTFTIEVSADGSAWTPVASGSFTASTSPQRVPFAAVTARFVRLTATGSVNGAQFSAASEIDLYPPAG